MLGKIASWARSGTSLPVLGRLFSDRRGVAAIEFAFIVPLLLALYFVTMEFAQGIETNKKVGRVGSMVADLITQQSDVSPSSLDAVMMIGEAILQPYNRTRPTIDIAAIQVTDEQNPRAIVEWSRRLDNGATGQGIAVNTQVTIPDTLMIPGSFLVRVSSQLDYRPVITWTADTKANLGLAAAFDRIQMNETYFLRPRMSQRINCPTC